jgi:hypothetical protein
MLSSLVAIARVVVHITIWHLAYGLSFSKKKRTRIPRGSKKARKRVEVIHLQTTGSQDSGVVVAIASVKLLLEKTSAK